MTPALSNSRVTTMGWAAYLACSWTWCIGMFLPVLMVRDFSFLGWVVFAIPNVIGAAAMGWVLARPGAALRIAEQHRTACLCFSVVTIAFHCYFMGWIIRALVGWIGPAAVGVIAVGIWLVTRGGRRELAIAWCVLIYSLIAFVVFGSMRGLPIQAFDPIVMDGRQLAYLAPICVFGFAFCPYLDLTFLRARALTAPAAGVAAFTLGFGVFFFVMILFTLWYAPWLRPDRINTLPVGLAWVVGGHMIVQSGFTIAAHARPIFADKGIKKVGALSLGLWAVAFSISLLSAPNAVSRHFPLAARPDGEIIYRLFMGFYGLVFPTYVWLCMVPTRVKANGDQRFKWTVLAVALAAAAPMFYFGFIAGRMIWLVPGLAVVLLAKLLMRGKKQEARGKSVSD